MDPDRWSRVRELFDAALAIERERRGAFLEAVEDAELRRELGSLLAAHEAPGRLDRLGARMDRVRAAALPGPPPAGAAGPVPGHGLAPGQRVGRHEIRGPLGAGGMGEVYRAYDPRLQREVAIKVLAPRLLERPGALGRFEQEARAASALSHPHIVTVHDVGEEPSFPYLVMELVEGQSLRQLLRGPLQPEQLLDLAAQLADGLGAAHDAGIVHRDLKPENVLVSRMSVAKIVDFGLARFRGAPDAPGSEEEEQPAGIEGTLGYVAPEILAGEPADARSDQFSLGAILYEMAAGVPAFPEATSVAAAARAAGRGPRPLAKLRPDLPAPLVEVVERCLRRDPRERHPTTRALLEELRALRRNAAPPARSGAARRALPLPAQRTRLVGRERELEDLQRLLGGAARLVTLTGPGGTGKTRLALRLAELVADRFPGGTVFVPLAAISDPALVPAAIAQTMGVVASAERRALDCVVADLRSAGAPALLVLDNFEQVVDAAPVVGELLAACPELTAVVTSREVLRLYGEHAFPVSPLALPDPAQAARPEALAENPSVALFVERAQAARAGFRLTAENARAVAELCARLDGLPLALELAAAHARIVPPDAMLVRLEHRLALLAGGARDLPGRQQTLRRTIDWSHDLLSDTEKAVFRRLAVFAGGFTPEAAQAVIDPFEELGAPVEEVLAALADKSLVQLPGGTSAEPRFTMLEILREYALERLADRGELDRTQRAHAAWFLVLAEEAGAAFVGSEDPAWLRRLEAEHDDLRVALAWLTRSGEAEWGLRLALALFPFWERGAHLAEGRRRLDALLEVDATRSAPALRARAAFAAGVLASTQRDFDRGKFLHRESLAIYRELGDDRGVVVSLVALGNQHVASGELDRARGFLEQSLAVWRALGDDAGYARSLSNLAFVARNQRRFDESRSLYRDAATLFAVVGDRRSRAWAVDHEGDVARDQADLGAAEALHAEALAAFRELGDGWGIGSSLADLGAIARSRGDRDAARRLYRDALASFAALDHWRGIARLLESLASLSADEGRDRSGLLLAAAAGALRERVGAPRAPALEEELGATVRAMRERLGADAARAASLEGAAMSAQQAIDLANDPSS